MEWIINAIPDAISLGVVFLLGCIGETINEKAGNLNLGIPGVMCFGAVGGTVGSLVYMKTIYMIPGFAVDPAAAMGFTQILSYLLLVLIGVAFAALFGAIAGGIFAFLTTTLKANQNVTGLALTTFGAGFGDFVMLILRNDETKPLFKKASNILRLGLPDYGILVYMAFVLAIVVFLILNRTRIGLSLRSVGENPATADSAGINTDAYKYSATLVGCGIAGLGGFFYLMSHVAGTWENSMTLQGYGWMVLALVIFTIWNPLIAIVGSLLFGFLSVSPYFIENVGFVLMEILKILPYIVTVIVLVITSIIGKKDVTPPDALGMNYFREER